MQRSDPQRGVDVDADLDLSAGSGAGDDVAVYARVHHDHDRLAQLIILSKISKSAVVQCRVSEQYVGNS